MMEDSSDDEVMVMVAGLVCTLVAAVFGRGFLRSDQGHLRPGQWRSREQQQQQRRRRRRRRRQLELGQALQTIGCRSAESSYLKLAVHFQ